MCVLSKKIYIFADRFVGSLRFASDYFHDDAAVADVRVNSLTGIIGIIEVRELRANTSPDGGIGRRVGLKHQ